MLGGKARARLSTAVKGNLNLEIDELGIEVRVTITPDVNGADITAESIGAVLGEKKVRSGIDPAAIDRAFRALAKGKTEPVTFVAAAGVPPKPGTPETVVFESLPGARQARRGVPQGPRRRAEAPWLPPP